MQLNLHPFMKRRNISQTDLADSVGISRGYMSEIISGKKVPSVSVLNRLAAALGTEPGALVDVAAQGATELAEHAQPYIHNPDAISVAAPDGLAAAVTAIAPGVRNPATWRALRSAPGFGIITGDLIVAELGAAPAPGELVLATPEDPESVTILRRWAGPWLFDDSGQEQPRSSSRGIAIVAVVRGVLRGPGI